MFTRAESKKCAKTAIAITVPHADCPTADEWSMLGAAGRRQTHWCDFAAAPAARQLASEFQRSAKSSTTQTFVSSTPRFICDLNRPTCQANLSPSIVRRLDKWFGKRGDWKKELDQGTRKRVPAGHPRSGDQEMKRFRDPIRTWIGKQGAKCSWLIDVHSFRHGLDVFDGQDRDLVLLDNRPDGPDTYYPYTVALAEYLQRNRIDVAVLKGATTGQGTDPLVCRPGFRQDLAVPGVTRFAVTKDAMKTIYGQQRNLEFMACFYSNSMNVWTATSVRGSVA